MSKNKFHFILSEIAEYNDCGLDVYVHRESMELIIIPQVTMDYLGDLDEYTQCIEEVENNFDQYVKIEAPNSNESFDIMKNFAEHLEDGEFKEQLITSLNKRKPFANFKHIIHNSGLREKWFEFKNQELVNRVIEILKSDLKGFDFFKLLIQN